MKPVAEWTVEDENVFMAKSFWAIGFLALLGCSGIVLYEVFVWLREGYWPVVDLESTLWALGWTSPRVSWIGVQKVIGYVLTISLWKGLLAVAVLSGLSGALLIHANDVNR